MPILFLSFVYRTNVYWAVIHGIRRKPYLSVVWNWYHFVAIAILHQPVLRNGLVWYKYAIATEWYQFHTTDAWWFSLNTLSGLLTTRGKILWNRTIVIAPWKSNYLYNWVWYEIIYPPLNAIGGAVAVCNGSPISFDILLGMGSFIHAGLKLFQINKTDPRRWTH